ncbi:MAG: hypothetical protein FRX49_02782 [Trebouxia sp. A1-2]|nr:MAG: hypothetical protein FRX49_02782 [Trebouxia sp. A1-2]
MQTSALRSKAWRMLARLGKATLAAAAAFLVAILLTEFYRTPVLLVGNLTIDIVDKKKALGGAISYAAAVATAFGVKSCIVTAASSDANLTVFDGHELHIVSTEDTLTFEHTYTWWGWWDRLVGFKQNIGFMAQGEQRVLDKAGRVYPFKDPSQHVLDALSGRTSVFLSDVETDSWPPDTVQQLAAQSDRWLVTRGEFGAHEFTADKGMSLVEPVKVTAVDTNGAGDTFATAYMIALAARDSNPGQKASWAASRAVQQPQSCKPHCVTEAIQREWWPARTRQQLHWLRGNATQTLSLQYLHQTLQHSPFCQYTKHHFSQYNLGWLCS